MEGRADARSLRPGFPMSDRSVSPAILDGLVAADPIWARLDAVGVEEGIPERERRLSRPRADIAALAAGLAGSGIRPTIEHGDLHGGNILVGPDGVRFYDWGETATARAPVRGR